MMLIELSLWRSSLRHVVMTIRLSSMREKLLLNPTNLRGRLRSRHTSKKWSNAVLNGNPRSNWSVSNVKRGLKR